MNAIRIDASGVRIYFVFIPRVGLRIVEQQEEGGVRAWLAVVGGPWGRRPWTLL